MLGLEENKYSKIIFSYHYYYLKMMRKKLAKKQKCVQETQKILFVITICGAICQNEQSYGQWHTAYE